MNYSSVSLGKYCTATMNGSRSIRPVHGDSLTHSVQAMYMHASRLHVAKVHAQLPAREASGK